MKKLLYLLLPFLLMATCVEAQITFRRVVVGGVPVWQAKSPNSGGYQNLSSFTSVAGTGVSLVNGVLTVNAGSGGGGDATTSTAQTFVQKTLDGSQNTFLNIGASAITQTSSARFSSDAEKASWNSKLDQATGDGRYLLQSAGVNFTSPEKSKLGAITGTNTGDQTLSISGQNLSLSNGNTIPLPSPGAVGLLANDVTTEGDGVNTLFGPKQTYWAQRAYADSADALRLPIATYSTNRTADQAVVAQKAPLVDNTFEAIPYSTSITVANNTLRPNKSIGALTANTSLTITGATNGSSGTLLFVQDGTGGRYLSINGKQIPLNAGVGEVTSVYWLYDGTKFDYRTSLAGVSSDNFQVVGNNVFFKSPSGNVSFQSQGFEHLVLGGNTSYYKRPLIFQTGSSLTLDGVNQFFTTAGTGPHVFTPDATKRYRLGVDNAGTPIAVLVP